MACVDIYQALTESRPYKQGMSHEKACGILKDMADKGWIDAEIVSQVDSCFRIQDIIKCAAIKSLTFYFIAALHIQQMYASTIHFLLRLLVFSHISVSSYHSKDDQKHCHNKYQPHKITDAKEGRTNVA